MDVLESVLRSSGATSYLEAFRNGGVDDSVLPLLCDKDLELLGVSEVDVRKEILKQSSNLQTSAKKKKHYAIEKEYYCIVLNQILSQLNHHEANLTCGLRRDIVICDIKLAKATKCLLNGLESFEKELKIIQYELKPRKKKMKDNKWMHVVGALSVVTAIIYFGLRKSYFK